MWWLSQSPSNLSQRQLDLDALRLRAQRPVQGWTGTQGGQAIRGAPFELVGRISEAYAIAMGASPAALAT